jgi:hypothetical protein
MENDEKNFSLQEGPAEAHISEEPVTESPRKKARHTLDTRKDKKRLHSMHHGALSRFPLEALASLGENIGSLRKIERKLRAELKPSGIVADIMFDRLWASYLRCLLAARAEALAVVSVNQPAGLARPASFLREATLPTLVTQDRGSDNEVLSPELFRQLVLVERYDRHFSREMYRALALLLIQRDGGEVGLEQYIGKLVGLNRDPSEGSKDA